ncbi:hypothetical protein COEREDRAFT_11431 [Coemansia reversa NRRL 1564]|uniref:Uncharacterized protein n=1 Tax=Coemansia reversa (strain ATCC 12441 / NRRL 1564) TaxID=763665 RepID=A0A2G5B334_COERN|nr:hypothetical protein COEREDRAFT_11431 [Coemansia reversa NRRL 1564]|eukprot:PIA13432.1 hypothetical protein COEREDRAFT_11431 [Coemansia reversa NRRL 1564]
MFAPMATPLPTFEPGESLMFENFPLPLPVEDTHTETQWINLESIAHNFSMVNKQAPVPTAGYYYMTIIILLALSLGLVFALAKMYFVAKELLVQLDALAIETTTANQLLNAEVLKLEVRLKESSEDQVMDRNNIVANSEDIKNVKMLAKDLCSKTKSEFLDAIDKQTGKCSNTEAVAILNKKMDMVIGILELLVDDAVKE